MTELTDHPRGAGARAGFTLIEILVVLTIVAALIGVAAPLLFRSQETGERAAAAAVIQQVKAALSSRSADPRVGDIPPTRLGEAGFESTNDLNEGIEVLVAVLGSEESTLNPFTDEQNLINTDQDRDPRRTTYGKSREFFEYSDPWGNPYIYFRLRDFDDNADATVRYMTGEGLTFDVSPVKNKKTRTFSGATDGYQVISMGPDMEFGTDDDVVSWRSS